MARRREKCQPCKFIWRMAGHTLRREASVWRRSGSLPYASLRPYHISAKTILRGIHLSLRSPGVFGFAPVALEVDLGVNCYRSFRMAPAFVHPDPIDRPDRVVVRHLHVHGATPVARPH